LDDQSLDKLYKDFVPEAREANAENAK